MVVGISKDNFFKKNDTKNDTKMIIFSVQTPEKKFSLLF